VRRLAPRTVDLTIVELTNNSVRLLGDWRHKGEKL
jgi:hypothetical protein